MLDQCFLHSNCSKLKLVPITDLCCAHAMIESHQTASHPGTASNFCLLFIFIYVISSFFFFFFCMSRMECTIRKSSFHQGLSLRCLGRIQMTCLLSCPSDTGCRCWPRSCASNPSSSVSYVSQVILLRPWPLQIHRWLPWN